jgi:hypothetical protein
MSARETFRDSLLNGEIQKIADSYSDALDSSVTCFRNSSILFDSFSQQRLCVMNFQDGDKFKGHAPACAGSNLVTLIATITVNDHSVVCPR